MPHIKSIHSTSYIRNAYLQAMKEEPVEKCCNSEKRYKEGVNISGFCISEVLVSYLRCLESHYNYSNEEDEKI